MRTGFQARILCFAILAAGTALFVPAGWAAGASATPAAPSPGEQTFCPVMTDELIDPEIYVDYQGKRVYFCCQVCRQDFLADPEYYLAELPQFGGAPSGAAAAKASSAPPPPPPVKLTFGRRLIHYLGKFHPVLVHFPIALALAGALAELIGWAFKKPAFASPAWYCVVLGALSAAIVAPLGWAAAAKTYPAALQQALFLHRWIGTGAAIWLALVFLLGWIARRRPAPGLRLSYRLALILGCVLIGVAAHFGATLIYGPAYFAW